LLNASARTGCPSPTKATSQNIDKNTPKPLFLKQVQLQASAGAAAPAPAVAEGVARVTLSIPTAGPELWWPVGLGRQPLYDLVIGFEPDGESCVAPSVTSLRSSSAEAGSRDIGANCGSTGGGAGGAAGAAGGAARAAEVEGDGCGWLLRRVGFRTVELVTDRVSQAEQELMPTPEDATSSDQDVTPDHGLDDVASPPIKGAAGQAGWGITGDGRWVNAQGAATKGAWWFPARKPDRQWPQPPGHERFEPADAQGSVFYLRVNGVPVYAKVGG
jgi:hypothetical protein